MKKKTKKQQGNYVEDYINFLIKEKLKELFNYLKERGYFEEDETFEKWLKEKFPQL